VPLSWEEELILDCLALKMKALQFLETSVIIYKSAWHNNPEDLNLQQLDCENLKCHIQSFLVELFFKKPVTIIEKC